MCAAGRRAAPSSACVPSAGLQTRLRPPLLMRQPHPTPQSTSTSHRQWRRLHCRLQWSDPWTPCCFTGATGSGWLYTNLSLFCPFVFCLFRCDVATLAHVTQGMVFAAWLGGGVNAGSRFTTVGRSAPGWRGTLRRTASRAAAGLTRWTRWRPARPPPRCCPHPRGRTRMMAGRAAPRCSCAAPWFLPPPSA